MSHETQGRGVGPMQRELEEIMSKVRAMEPGGDLEGLLEEGAAKFKVLLYEIATRERLEARAAAEADFPPSGLSSVRGDDAPDRREVAAGADVGRDDPL